MHNNDDARENVGRSTTYEILMNYGEVSNRRRNLGLAWLMGIEFPCRVAKKETKCFLNFVNIDKLFLVVVKVQQSVF